MKKVMVIDEEILEGELKAELEVVAGLPKDKAAAMASMLMTSVSIGRFFLPGNLLASFGAEFRNEHDIAYSDEVAKMLRGKIWENQPVRVLILACTDEGSEVKK